MFKSTVIYERVNSDFNYSKNGTRLSFCQQYKKLIITLDFKPHLSDGKNSMGV